MKATSGYGNARLSTMAPRFSILKTSSRVKNSLTSDDTENRALKGRDIEKDSLFVHRNFKDDFEVIDELSESTLVGTEINISIKISNEVMSI